MEICIKLLFKYVVRFDIIKTQEMEKDWEIIQNTIKMSYNKRQFYDRILTPMKAMGMIDYDMYKKRYRISDRLNKALQKIGLMWVQEVSKTV